MTEDKFWELVERSKKDSEGSFERQTEVLKEILGALSPAEILSFAQQFTACTYRAYRWDLWAAAYLVNGGCSDDGFEYFRSWLISRGRALYEAALQNPDTLATVEDVGDDFSFEEFGYVYHEAYEAVTGEEMPDDTLPDFPEDPGMPEWHYDFDDNEEQAKRLPKLWAKYGS